MITCTKRLVAACCVLASLAACVSSDDATNPGTTWDFRTPLTAIDLGSPLHDRVDFDGELPLEVVFPTGETLLIDSTRITGYRTGLLPPDVSGRALDEVTYDAGSFETLPELRVIIDAFTALDRLVTGLD